MEEFLKELPKLAQEKLIENKKYFQKLKKRTPKNLDVVMQDLHEKEFEKTDCLTCGNCCKTTSPIFTNKDIERISKHFRMKVLDFTNQYLESDSDDFYVLKTAPCSFLDLNDNMCMIYDVRPKACGEYPHTDRRKFIQITDLTLKNTEICPAAYNIVEALKIKLPK
ncbi:MULTISPECIES: YkgJ family cysteine cluster protein [Flavobacteriaceae]|uniref:YkgJ family cysteine cluster protein n=2 Tax=Flavobacteriaceae TaxID=49546 RepID=A0A4Y8AWC6_9FLAO|nr:MULTISPECIES: YkgJ family cysteine cluster protein [Flavobacteriaceae]TEW76435.1 YkgJ family cysteine cluster protein [Gramella jeungdoensis]GGK52834.1 Fe-S oxidoreductase [Lutibacter litoralis]